QPRVAVAHPWKPMNLREFYPERVAQPKRDCLYNPFRVGEWGAHPSPGCAIATLGCVVQPLRGKELATLGCVVQPLRGKEASTMRSELPTAIWLGRFPWNQPAMFRFRRKKCNGRSFRLRHTIQHLYYPVDFFRRVIVHHANAQKAALLLQPQ